MNTALARFLSTEASSSHPACEFLPQFPFPESAHAIWDEPTNSDSAIKKRGADMCEDGGVLAAIPHHT